jgi:hypothetical protein
MRAGRCLRGPVWFLIGRSVEFDFVGSHISVTVLTRKSQSRAAMPLNNSRLNS